MIKLGIGIIIIYRQTLYKIILPNKSAHSFDQNVPQNCYVGLFKRIIKLQGLAQLQTIHAKNLMSFEH